MLMNPMLPGMYKMIYKVRGHWYTHWSESCLKVEMIWLCIVLLPISEHCFWKNGEYKVQNSRIKKCKIVFSSDYEIAFNGIYFPDLWYWLRTLLPKIFILGHEIVPMNVLLIFLSYHFKWKKCSFLGQYLNYYHWYSEKHWPLHGDWWVQAQHKNVQLRSGSIFFLLACGGKLWRVLGWWAHVLRHLRLGWLVCILEAIQLWESADPLRHTH